MNTFGWIAEELTLLEERLDTPQCAPHAERLRRALQRAFQEACQASREMRYREEKAEATIAAPNPLKKILARAR